MEVNNLCLHVSGLAETVITNSTFFSNSFDFFFFHLFRGNDTFISQFSGSTVSDTHNKM